MEIARLEIALSRISAWRPGHTLDLSNLGLTVLPEIPAEVEILRCHRNRIASLREVVSLPRLRELSCDENELTELPDDLRMIFPSLRSLSCNGNQLSELPNTLPDGLREIYCHRNRLTTIPPKLPSSLLILACCSNRITVLPSTLPQSLETLACANNQLSTLPENLPSSLIEIYCDGNLLLVNQTDLEPPRFFLPRLRAAEELQARERILARTAIIKEELMMEVWAPWRLEKRLTAGESLETILAAD